MRTRPTWHEAISRFSPPERRRVLRALNLIESGTPRGRYLVANLKRDRFIPADALEALLKVLARASHMREATLWRRYERLCQRHKLRGGELRRAPIQIGRAVEETEFVIGVQRANPKLPQREVRTLLHGAVTGSTPSPARAGLASVQMTRNPAWVTWDRPSAGSAHPFAFSKARCADEIRGSLGLRMLFYGKPILTFVYAGEACDALHRPTVADAGLYEKFTPPPEPPPPELNEFGLTRPWDEPPPPPPRRSSFRLVPLPEALHAPIRFPDSFSAQLVASRRHG